MDLETVLKVSTGRVVRVACYESINLANELSLNVLREVMGTGERSRDKQDSG